MFSIISHTMAALLSLAAPVAPAQDAAPRRTEWLGLQVCVGDPADGLPCHVRLFPPARAGKATDDDSQRQSAAADTVPLQVSLLGTWLCLGPVPDGIACDIRLGDAAPTATADA